MLQSSPLVDALAHVTSYTFDEYLALPSGPSDWLIEPILPAGGRAIIFAPPKAGKSSFALQLAIALARGEALLDYPVSHKAKVLYAQVDNPRSLWQARLRKLGAHGIPLPPPDMLRFLDRESMPFPFNILAPAHAAAFAREVKAQAPGLVIVDTLRESFRGDENESDRLQQVFSTFTLCCRPSALLYVHHGKKSPNDPMMEPSLMDAGRGSSYIPGAVDTVLHLKAKGRRADLIFQGRAIEETTRHIVQNEDTFLWSLSADEAFHSQAKAVLADPSLDSDRARARHLAEVSGRPEENCRTLLRRLAGSL